VSSDLPSPGDDKAVALPPPLRVPLTVCPPHPCVYLPGRTARFRAFAAGSFDPDMYRQFMDANFRRSGELFYQPVCPGCQACVQIRVPVARFEPSASQRRVLRRNQDMKVTFGIPTATDEKFDIYRRYSDARHSPKQEDRRSFEMFLYESPVETIEAEYRDESGTLLGVGICDFSPTSVSSVYFYFDPAASSRSLGTYSALVEIELARQIGLAWYYLGYWVAGSRSMEYKRRFRPHELLGADGVWRDTDRH
jgi:arginine-tRNA-protein transferase